MGSPNWRMTMFYFATILAYCIACLEVPLLIELHGRREFAPFNASGLREDIGCLVRGIGEQGYGVSDAALIAEEQVKLTPNRL